MPNTLGKLVAEPIGDHRSDVPAVGAEAPIAEDLAHQGRPQRWDATELPGSSSGALNP
jgi:hypothetical protein